MKKYFYLPIILLLFISFLVSCEPRTTETVHIKKPKDKVETKITPAQQKIVAQKITSPKPNPKPKLKPVPPSPPPLPEKVLIDAPLVSQLPELPNGCEITSLTMLLQTAGIKVDKLTLAKQMKKVPFKKNGYNGNPNEGFVGNMYHGGPGFAVYHGPVADLAKKYLKDRVVDLTGSKWIDVEKALAKKHPVWVITNSAFQRLPDKYFETWHTKSGDMKVTMHEHSVLLTGYDKENIYFNDPLTNTKNKRVNKEAFEDSWEQMGSQAITYK